MESPMDTLATILDELKTSPSTKACGKLKGIKKHSAKAFSRAPLTPAEAPEEMWTRCAHGTCCTHYQVSALYMMHKDFFSDRKSTRLNSSHHSISYAVFCLK